MHWLQVTTLGYHLTKYITHAASSMSDAPERVKGPPGESREAAEPRSSPGSPGHLLRLPGEVVRRRAAKIESQINAHFQTAYPTRSYSAGKPTKACQPAYDPMGYTRT